MATSDKQGDTKTQDEKRTSDDTISGDKQSVPQVTMSDPQNTSTPKVEQSQIVNDPSPESAFYEVEKILYKRRRQKPLAVQGQMVILPSPVQTHG